MHRDTRDHGGHVAIPKLPEAGALVNSARLISAVAGAVTAVAVLGGPLGAALAAAAAAVGLNVAVAMRERSHSGR
jgi:hypothetical protein